MDGCHGSAIERKQIFIPVQDMDIVRKLFKGNNYMNLSKTMIV